MPNLCFYKATYDGELACVAWSLPELVRRAQIHILAIECGDELPADPAAFLATVLEVNPLEITAVLDRDEYEALDASWLEPSDPDNVMFFSTEFLQALAKLELLHPVA